MTAKRWLIQPPPPPAGVAGLAQELDVLPLTARLLWQRGLSGGAEAKRFLEPGLTRLQDFKLLPGAEAAGGVLADAIRSGRPIAIAGDYDADGITASALLAEFIVDAGGQVQVFLPDRELDGYGLNPRILEQVFATGAGLLVTVDSGITACAEVAQARAHGLTVVVTDHHEPGPDLPDANVLVDPKVSGPEAFRPLAGVGVALTVVRAAAAALGQESPARLRKYLDLVALGTVADVVPLIGENRILVWSGLQVMNQNQRPGLVALAMVAGLTGCTLSAQDLGYRLGPRLNAAGRLGDPRRALDCLLTTDPARAQELAAVLDQENGRRQALEQSVLRAAVERLGREAELPVAIVVSDPEWPLGILGLVASKLCERFHRPCFALSERDGVARGSGRSLPGFPLHAVLESLAPLLTKWGGHEMAAGVTLPASRLAEFTRAFQAAAAERLRPEQLVAELAIEAETGLDEITPRLVQELKRLEPHGFGNTRPLLAVTGVGLAGPPRVVGERHLKLRVTTSGRRVLDVIGFGLGERAAEVGPEMVLDIAGYAGENEWNGSRCLQLEMKDFRESAGA